jgi:hypothetical protein
MWSHTLLATAAIVGLIAAPSAGATQSASRRGQTAPEMPMPADYDDPGPKPENVLPAILGSLRRTLRDPSSIKDFTLCDVQASPAFRPPLPRAPWRRARWRVDFALNAKNAYGGYSGLQPFSATFENGALTDAHAVSLGAELNAKYLSMTEECRRVPDAEIQQLLQQVP